MPNTSRQTQPQALPLPQFALDCDEADDMVMAVGRLRQQHGKIDENIRVAAFQQAIVTQPLPIKCLDALAELGMVPMRWIHQMGGLDGVDWIALFGWWSRNGEPERIGDIAEAADYALWKTQEFGVGDDQPYPPAQQAHALLETLASHCFSEHDFRRRCGCAGQEGGAMLMCMAALYPDNTWMTKVGLDPVHLLWDGLNHALMAHDLLVPRPGGSLIDKWRAAHPSHEQAWQTVWNHRLREAHEMGQWLDEWMPGSQWEGSPLQKWCEQPTPKGQGKHPLDGWVPGSLEANPKIVAATLSRKMGVVGWPTEHARHAHLQSAIMELGGNIMVRTPDYLPSPVGLALCPTREDARTDKWLDTHADSEQGRQEILDILSARDAGRILERLPLERIVKWMDTGTQEWAKWKSPQGQSLFLLWISSRQPHDRYVKPSVLREIVQKAPNWLTEHTSDGRVVIDTMALPDELDSEIKRTLLDQEIADVPDRPKPKRRF